MLNMFRIIKPECIQNIPDITNLRTIFVTEQTSDSSGNEMLSVKPIGILVRNVILYCIFLQIGAKTRKCLVVI